MTLRRLPRPRWAFPSFAGVALADILANSVAIVIIMIVVMLMSRHEQEREKLAQTEDVAVMLSRELASSFVMNALPTSPPAQLHDYVASPLDRNPHHAIMPIVELHRAHLRDHYTGATYPRDALLRRDNAFDAYLRTLSPEQLAALRVDIHSTRLFYVFMSILKAHGHTPRHWHFIGTEEGVGFSPAALAARSPGDVAPARAGGRGAGEGGPGERGPVTALGGEAAWPRDVALGLSAGSGGYPTDSAAPGGATLGEGIDLPGEVHGAGRAGRGGERPSAEPGEGGVRFRAAVRADETAAAADDQPAINWRRVVLGLWAFMAEEQAAADAGQPSRLPRYDFLRHVLGAAVAADLDDAAAGADRIAALRGLLFLLRNPRLPSEPAIGLRPEVAPALRGQALAVYPNEPVARAVWLGDAAQALPEAPVTTPVTLRLGLHAAVHEGVRVTLGRDSLLLTPYAEAAPDATPRWRVVTLVDAGRSDFVTGFLKAAVDGDGRLLLPVDDNAVAVGGLRLESRYPPVALRGETRRLWLYGLVVALFGLGIVARYWRPA